MALYMFLMLLGAFVSVLVTLNEAMAKRGFSWQKFAKHNAVPTLINIIVGFALIIACVDDSNAPIEINKLNSFILGATSQLIYKKLCNILLPYKRTIVGNNNKAHNDED